MKPKTTMTQLRRIVRGIDAVRGNKDLYDSKAYRYILVVMLRQLYRGLADNEADDKTLGYAVIIAKTVKGEVKLDNIDKEWKAIKAWTKKGANNG
jgi:hypothetical protein